MNIFASLPKGDSASWHDDPLTDSNGVTYTSATWALSYVLAGAAAAPLTLSAVTDSTGWKTSITAAQSAALPAGAYWWQAVLTFGIQRVTVGQGQLQITPNLGDITAGPYDGRTFAQQALAAAEQALSQFKSGGRMKSYQIGGRQMSFSTDTEILLVISYWRGRVIREGADASIAQGLGNPRHIFARFV